MRDHSCLFVLAFVAILSGASGHCASVTLGTATARPNGVALVPVEISAATDLAGVNLRVAFDPDVFPSPSVLREGSLLEPSHLLSSHSPEAGIFNIVAYTPLGTPPFSAHSGTVFTLALQIAPTAPDGDYPVEFSTSGPALLASSGLSDRNGISISHTALAGSVAVRSATSCDLTGDGQVTCEDLLLLMKDWHRISAAPLLVADINGDTRVDEKDLMLLSKEWQRTEEGQQAPKH